MSEQPPVQPPDQPSGQPLGGPAHPPTAGNPPTQPMAAFESAPAAGPPTPPGGPAGPPAAGPASGNEPRPNVWRRSTSTSGGRWGLGLAAVALVFLMVLGIGITGLAMLRNHDRVNLMGLRQDRQSLRQDGPGNGQGFGNGNGKGNAANKDRNGQRYQQGMPGMPGTPGGRGQGMGGLGNMLGGTALHGTVTATINGSAQALLFQRGEVTAVTDTSITLKSTDGFVGTYGRNASTITRAAAPVKGGQALVLARSSDKVAITTMAMPGAAGVAPSN